MLRLMLFFLLLAAISLLVTWLADNHGRLSVDWLGYHIEADIMTATGFVVAVFISGILLIELFLYIKNTPKRFSQSRNVQRHDKTLLAITRGFAAIAAGDAKKTKQAASVVARLTKRQSEKNRLIAHIFSAQAAQMEGNNVIARKHFSALLEDKDTEFVAVSGLLESARAKGELGEALALAERAYKLNPNSKGAAHALLNLYKQSGKWEAAEQFLEKYKKKEWFAGLFGSNGELDISRERAIIYFMYGKKYSDKDEKQKAFEFAEKANKLQPNFLPAVALCAKLASDLGKKRKAAFVIERAWKHSPYTELRDIYFNIFNSDDENKTVKRAQNLLSLNKTHPESHRAVARAALKAGDITLARNHAKLAMADNETTSLCRLMVDIEKAAKESEEVIQQWSAKAKYAMRDPAWTCRKCGGQSSS